MALQTVDDCNFRTGEVVDATALPAEEQVAPPSPTTSQHALVVSPASNPLSPGAPRRKSVLEPATVLAGPAAASAMQPLGPPLILIGRPLATISAPLGCERRGGSVDRDGSSQNSDAGDDPDDRITPRRGAWAPAPKRGSAVGAALAPVILMHDDGRDSAANRELGEFCDSLLLSMQIRLKVDAELSSFHQIPSGESRRTTAMYPLSMGAAAAMSAAHVSPAYSTMAAATRAGGGSGIPTGPTSEATPGWMAAVGAAILHQQGPASGGMQHAISRADPRAAPGSFDMLSTREHYPHYVHASGRTSKPSHLQWGGRSRSRVRGLGVAELMPPMVRQDSGPGAPGTELVSEEPFLVEAGSVERASGASGTPPCLLVDPASGGSGSGTLATVSFARVSAAPRQHAPLPRGLAPLLPLLRPIPELASATTTVSSPHHLATGGSPGASYGSGRYAAAGGAVAMATAAAGSGARTTGQITTHLAALAPCFEAAARISEVLSAARSAPDSPRSQPLSSEDDRPGLLEAGRDPTGKAASHRAPQGAPSRMRPASPPSSGKLCSVEAPKSPPAPAQEPGASGPDRHSYAARDSSQQSLPKQEPHGQPHHACPRSVPRRSTTRSTSWHGGTPGVHPDPTRVVSQHVVQLSLCRTVEELVEGVVELRPLDGTWEGAGVGGGGGGLRMRWWPHQADGGGWQLGGAAPVPPAAAAGAVSAGAVSQGSSTGAAQCRSVVLRGRWGGAPVAVRLVASPALTPANAALRSGLAAAAALHPHLARVHAVRMMPPQEGQQVTPAAGDAAGSGGALAEAGGGGSGAGWPLSSLRRRPGDGVVAVVMELCSMGSLATLSSAAYSPFRPHRAWPAYMARRALLRTAAEVAAALAHLHRFGLTHGSLTPANVLVTPTLADKRGFCVKVADASLAAQLLHNSPQTRSTATGIISGPSGLTATSLPGSGPLSLLGRPHPHPAQRSSGPSPSAAAVALAWAQTPQPAQAPGTAGPCTSGFTAPEVLAGGAASPAADVYAFGALLWALASGEGHVSGATGGALAATGPGGGALLGREWPAGAHPHLRPLYAACVGAAPEQRPTMQQVLDELSAVDSLLAAERPRGRAAAAAGFAAISNSRAAAGAGGSRGLPGAAGVLE